MKTTYLIIGSLIITLINSCKAQNNNLKQDRMKTFDIEIFNKNKVQNTYNYTSKDGTSFSQSEDFDEYLEIIKEKNSPFEIQNTYYKTGVIQMEVHRYATDFIINMKEYNQQGTLIKETDYDKPFKFTFKDILKFIKKRNIDMNSSEFILSRGKSTGRLTWDITWEKQDKTGLRRAWIDGVTGEIIKEFDENYTEG
ncbi:MAG: hypothetical protein L3J23_07385 [Flavobacteriaceae bacterium]|nr:hypothetical protein [Flavobacteriaceae bacterium]